MEAAEGLPALDTEDKTMRFFYSEKNDPVPTVLPQPPLGRQVLLVADSTHALPWKAIFEQGAFYEIDHEKLPPKSPIQLKTLRLVMVSETTVLNVTVSFPSTLSLRSHFAAGGSSEDLPELDERFVMSANQAGRILRWRIDPAQVNAGKRLKSFWLLSPASDSDMQHIVSEVEEEDTTKATSSCLLALKRAGMVEWGARRKVKYIGGHCELVEEKEVELEEQRISRDSTKWDRKENKKLKKINKKGNNGKGLKRPRFAVEQDGKCRRGSKDRWSKERYETAEKRLLEIMRSKKAELGRPILRQALRDEARKHIGDTGLLDHLLKHMAGKIVSNGTERFRRRHNSEGAMEYWLEPAELVETRRLAGVNDPFWVPPPGWKLGDSILPHKCDTDCQVAIEDLKQQLVLQIMRYNEQQICLKKLEKETRETKPEAAKVMRACEEKCKLLLEWKAKQEVQFAALCDSVKGLKEEVQFMKEKQVSEVTQRSKEEEQQSRTRAELSNTTSYDGCISSNSNGKADNVVSVVCDKIAAARKCDLKICNPQGTFLWPSSSAPAGIVMASSPRAHCDTLPTPTCAASGEMQKQQEHLMLFQGGGPPSASSSTASKPKLLLFPGPVGSTSTGLRPLAPAAAHVCAPTYGTMARAASASLWSLNATKGNREDALMAAGSPWTKASHGWVGVTTDLALATPSPKW
ncbi:hypothetical protein HPP92_003655 [Vanilla planifolia]|uniref:PTC1-like winged helix-turn-helix domain-containing protein n=1 Tax=Vanilla planifolia TaxID=51239 RepID=A0A835RVI9_VANPL|nr:hypothetical protein HPP92_003655 [Vanilla planifolia]